VLCPLVFDKHEPYGCVKKNEGIPEGLLDEGTALPHRQLLTEEERQGLLGIPPDAHTLARLFILARSYRNLVAERLSDANRLGYAVQLALLRHPGTALAYLNQPTKPLVTWMAGQLDIPAIAFDQYARRPQTTTDHARELASTRCKLHSSRWRPAYRRPKPPASSGSADRLSIARSPLQD